MTLNRMTNIKNTDIATPKTLKDMYIINDIFPSILFSLSKCLKT
ncbi:hypothetical protein [Athalassotoga sp.]